MAATLSPPDPSGAPSIDKDESNGFLSSILSAAHNAAHMIEAISKDENKLHPADSPHRKRGLDLKLDQLLQGEAMSNVSTNSARSSAASPSGTQLPTATSLHPVLLASNVHFEPVHGSPVSTMGTGNLLLLHFDKKRNRTTSLVDEVKVPVGLAPSTEMPSNRLSVSGHDRKVVKRKSISNGSVDDHLNTNDDDVILNAESSFTETSETGSTQELEQILDSATISRASKKKNREFHHAFRKIPSSERLIGDYSCALSKDILVQGKMYLSPHYICFNSNILGWVTNISIPLQEVIQIEKKSTAVLFPNGMIIRTLHQKFVFATFLLRDATFNVITRVWHDALQEKTTDESSGRKRGNTVRSRGRSIAEHDLTSGAASDYSDADLMLDPIGTSSTNSLDAKPERPDGPSRLNSAKVLKQKKTEARDDDSLDLEILGSEDESGDKLKPRSFSPGDKGDTFNGFKNPGPKAHAPTKSNYTKDSNDVDITDVTFKAPLGVVYELLFGQDTSTYIKILENQKNFDILTGKIVGISSDNKERDYSYIKPLGGSIGPKQTKCLITDTVKFCDFTKYIEVEQVTQTPDVPSGNSFKVKTRLFFTWGPDNTTKLFVVTAIEWSAKSWIKGAIERGSIDGQKDSMKVMVETLTDILSSGGQSSGSKKKRRKTKLVSSPTPPKAEEKAEAKPLSVTEQISKLLESIGELVPVRIPFLSSALTGGIVIILFSFVYSFCLLWLIGGSGSSSKLHIANGDDALTKLVRVNDQKYFMLPTSDTYLSDKKTRKLNEAKMWNWINERSQGHVKGRNFFDRNDSDYEDFVGQEFDEVVKLAKKRIDQLYNQVDGN